MVVLFFFCVLVFNIFVLLAPYVFFHSFSKVSVTEWPPIGKKAAHSAYDMFSWYKYLIVNLVFFPPLVFGVGIFFRLCLFVMIALLYLETSLMSTFKN